VVEGTAL